MKPRAAWVVLVVLALSATGCGAWKRLAYSGLDRDEWQQPERVVAALELRPGMRVADVGAGGGYFTFRLADAVGPTGRLYAVDVDPDMLEYLRERAADEQRANVVVVEATYDDPKLPDAGVDLVLVVNTYHHLDKRVEYFERVERALAPGGRVAIIDFSEGGFVEGHFTEPATIEKEFGEAGYALAAKHDFLERQSFLVFTPAR